MPSRLCSSAGKPKPRVASGSQARAKLWDAFRKPLDEAFNRKSVERGSRAPAVELSEHDRRVLEASKAVEAANASGDAQKIRTALAELEAPSRPSQPQNLMKIRLKPGEHAPAATETEAAAEAPVAAACTRYRGRVVMTAPA